VLAIENAVDLLEELGANLGLVAVTDRFDEQLLERLFIERLPENVENPTAERLALLFELQEEPLENLALSGFNSDDVP
jgi:hypothetical protein